MKLTATRIWYYLSSIPSLITGIRNWPSVGAACLGLRRGRPFVVELRGDGARFEARTALDVWVIKETCLDDQYDLAPLRGLERPVVIDIGAGLGDFAVYVAKRHPQSRILAFEPAPESFSLLERNLAINGAAHVEAFPIAVAGRRSSVTIDTRSRQAVRYRTVTSDESDSPETTVAARTLDDVLRDASIARCDLLKIDCEGAEYEILFAASDETLRRIDALSLEVHDGVTEYSRKDLERFLGAHGFDVETVPNRAHADLCILVARRTGRGDGDGRRS